MNSFRSLININKRIVNNGIAQLPKFYSSKFDNIKLVEPLKSTNANKIKSEKIENLIINDKLKIKNLNWGETTSNNKNSKEKKQYKRPLNNRGYKTDYKKTYPRTSNDKPQWLTQKEAIKSKIDGEKWEPEKRLSRMAMDKIRFLHKELGQEFNVSKLSKEFKISPESIRRILKSNYKPTQEVIERQETNRKSKRLEFVKSFQSSTPKEPEVNAAPKQFETYEEYKKYLNDIKKANSK